MTESQRIAERNSFYKNKVCSIFLQIKIRTYIFNIISINFYSHKWKKKEILTYFKMEDLDFQILTQWRNSLFQLYCIKQPIGCNDYVNICIKFYNLFLGSVFCCLNFTIINQHLQFTWCFCLRFLSASSFCCFSSFSVALASRKPWRLVRL